MLFYMILVITPSVKCQLASCASRGSCEIRLLDSFSLKDMEEGRSPSSISARLEIGLHKTVSAITIHRSMAMFSFSLCVTVCPASLLYSATVKGHLISISGHISVLVLC